MTIACLAWGSLVWDRRELPVQGEWLGDGPLLPVEFARVSSDGRLTLVVVPAGPEVRSLWAPFVVTTVAEARDALARREGIGRTLGKNVGVWLRSDSTVSDPPTISSWARELRLEAVVWTCLPPRFAGTDGRVPSEEEAVAYLQRLPRDERCRAERYIRMTPRQVNTPYRRRFEREFGWTPLDRR